MGVFYTLPLFAVILQNDSEMNQIISLAKMSGMERLKTISGPWWLDTWPPAQNHWACAQWFNTFCDQRNIQEDSSEQIDMAFLKQRSNSSII